MIIFYYIATPIILSLWDRKNIFSASQVVCLQSDEELGICLKRYLLCSKDLLNLVKSSSLFDFSDFQTPKEVMHVFLTIYLASIMQYSFNTFSYRLNKSIPAWELTLPKGTIFIETRAFSGIPKIGVLRLKSLSSRFFNLS